MKIKRFGFLAVTLVAIVFLSACWAQKEPKLSAEQKIDNLLDKYQEIIDREWPKLVSQRQECEVTCQGADSCACLESLKKDEQSIITLMVLKAMTYSLVKEKPREFTLYYAWQPGDKRSHDDFKDFLLAIPESYFTQDKQLGVYVISHGQPDESALDISAILQELYQEKKLTDIQGYLDLVQFRFSAAEDLNFGIQEKMEVPYFVLTQKSKDKENTENLLFYASVFDQELFKDFSNQKYPWYGDSISALVLVTRQ